MSGVTHTYIFVFNLISALTGLAHSILIKPDSVLNSSAIFHLTLSALQPHRPGTLKNDVSATLITAAVFYVGLESTVILDFGRAAIAMHVRTFSRQTGVEATLNLLSSAL
ncbi:neutral amino acid transporter A [Echinococcus multilocularis]|uniref:Neutral amino acid transporter A n=1 Tax=Echinococcus multilocularis TaxID=6211 RepID=A0A0S4MIS2_ECHMU|nr:neutral amino acid transporter A [Echinococcus multilocularis]